MDTLSAEQRSLNMAKIHSKDTKPEVFLRSALHKAGFRFRKNDKRYLGTPDIFLPHYNAVIFIHGCFWHGHKNCRLFRLPKTNVEYWKNKIERNMARDRMLNNRKTKKAKTFKSDRRNFPVAWRRFDRKLQGILEFLF
ncbi:very short patch repair endonuclease [uncultured Treponema sp.]|uniref:very short patch repair endonuclease n=1 Tax=uncultured Treponema sp. TaxID=162155 RepID=UPI0025CF28BC|nr:very short patch repair endonuclease [uncultured Treponema sp.]